MLKACSIRQIGNHWIIGYFISLKAFRYINFIHFCHFILFLKYFNLFFVNFIHLYNVLLPHLSCPTSFNSLISLSSFQCCYYCYYNYWPLGPISADHKHMDVWLTSRAWVNYQQPHPKEKWLSPSVSASASSPQLGNISWASHQTMLDLSLAWIQSSQNKNKQTTPPIICVVYYFTYRPGFLFLRMQFRSLHVSFSSSPSLSFPVSRGIYILPRFDSQKPKMSVIRRLHCGMRLVLHKLI